jgi:ribonuclease BN (tRNA processing enzyme)
LRVILLGTGAGSTVGSSRFKSGVLVESGEDKVLFDFGSGVSMRLEDMNKIPRAVFITHLHVDHFSGIFDHLVQRAIQGLPVIRVYSPPGFLEVLSSYKRAGNQISAEVREDGLPQGGEGELEVYSVGACHKIYAVSYIITDGRKRILYSGDTSEPCEDVLRESRKVDLVIHEASCLENCKQWGHTSLKEVLEMFNKPVITHIPAQLSKKFEELTGDRGILAKDGLVIDV